MCSFASTILIRLLDSDTSASFCSRDNGFGASCRQTWLSLKHHEEWCKWCHIKRTWDVISGIVCLSTWMIWQMCTILSSLFQSTSCEGCLCVCVTYMKMLVALILLWYFHCLISVSFSKYLNTLKRCFPLQNTKLNICTLFTRWHFKIRQRHKKLFQK